MSNGSVRKTIDEQINELIPELSDRRFAFKMAEHQRQRILYGDGKVGGNPTVLSMPVNVKLSANDLVEIYLKGGHATPMISRDILSYYTMLRSYLDLWAQRSNAMPDEDMPPIEDFVNIDDYLRSIHDEYFVAAVVHAEPPKKTTSPFRARRFAEETMVKEVASPFERPQRYNSAITQFHQSVWGRK